tara:strand:- start:3803 stop:4267 length:465 start_codon:yes stop_codon:yes gene_type:complete
MSIDYQELTGKLIIENGELKNQLSHALKELEDVYNMVESEPNDMALGEIVRQHYWANTEEPESTEEPIYIYESPDEGKTLYRRRVGETVREQVETPEPPVSRERAEARLQYLRTEIAHEDYHDGWTLQGMKDEVEWLENQLGIDSKQMELFDNH